MEEAELNALHGGVVNRNVAMLIAAAWVFLLFGVILPIAISLGQQ